MSVKRVSAQERADRAERKQDLLRFALEIYREHNYPRREGDERHLPPTVETIIAQAQELQKFVEE